MTTPSSGPISAQHINTELGYPTTQQLSLNDSAVRTLAGVSSGTISYNDLRGKSSFTAVAATGPTAPGYNTYDIGGYRYHIYRDNPPLWQRPSVSPHFLNVTNTGTEQSIQYLIVAGGASGGGHYGGGGGAGGVRYGTAPLPATGSFNLHIGSGGDPRSGYGSSYYVGDDGNDSYVQFPSGTITSTGGGGGAVRVGGAGRPGGSGGGGTNSGGAAGTGNTPPVSPPQGNPGGAAGFFTNGGGGGGGAGSAGTQPGYHGTPSPTVTSAAPGGPGGNGVTTNFINANSPSIPSWMPTSWKNAVGPTGIFGGGGGGGHGSLPAGAGGPGGGGAGGSSATSGTPGISYTGGGGGGAAQSVWASASGAGGNGIVILKYPL
tara:strand:- start:6496 stop:7620 length:1125 start_codon:yes stop_codon:yes gene_type:complete